MKKAAVILFALLLLGSLTACRNNPSQEESEADGFSENAYRASYTMTDYKDETVICIGHKSPDTDTVMSAIAMATLLNGMGIKAEARVTETISAETEYALSFCGMACPEVLTDATGKQLWLVDHSESKQAADGAQNARIVGITDHHVQGDLASSELIKVCVGAYGSNCTQIYKEFTECGVPVDEKTARVLLMGILSDTENAEKTTTTEMDREAIKKLCRFLSLNETETLYNALIEAKLSYKGMSETEIFYSDYKEYSHNGISYGIACVEVADESEIDAMGVRMLAVLNGENQSAANDYLFLKVSDVKSAKCVLYFTGRDKAAAAALAEKAFGTNEFLTATEEGRLVFSPSVSRKTVLAPAINLALDTE